MTGDRRADFEWRNQKIQEIQEKNSSPETQFREAIQKTQMPLTYESLVQHKKNLIGIQNSFGNNWETELLEEKTVEKKTWFGSNKEILEKQVNETKRMEYSSYFVSLKDWLENYKKELKKQNVMKSSHLIHTSLNSLDKIIKSLQQGNIDIQYLDNNFFAFVKEINQIVEEERSRVNKKHKEDDNNKQHEKRY